MNRSFSWSLTRSLKVRVELSSRERVRGSKCLGFRMEFGVLEQQRRKRGGSIYTGTSKSNRVKQVHTGRTSLMNKYWNMDTEAADR